MGDVFYLNIYASPMKFMIIFDVVFFILHYYLITFSSGLILSKQHLCI